MIISRVNTAILNIAHSTDCLEKTSKLVIALIDATVQSKFFTQFTTSLSLAKNHFKSLTAIVGTLDVINQLSLWLVGDSRTGKSYLDEAIDKGWSAKLSSKLLLLVGKGAETVVGFAAWGIIPLSQFVANSLGSIVIAKDALMLGSSIASSVKTLPEAYSALRNYNVNPNYVNNNGPNSEKSEKGAHAENSHKLTLWKARLTTVQEPNVRNQILTVIANEKLRTAQVKNNQNRVNKWQGFIANNDYNAIEDAINYKVEKWSMRDANLNKDWWKKLIVAINDIAKIVIISTVLALTAASLILTITPWLFVGFGLVSGAIGFAKSLYDSDPANNPEKVTEFIQTRFA